MRALQDRSPTDFDDGRTETFRCLCDVVHVLLQVHIQKFKDKVQLGIGMDDLKQPETQDSEEGTQSGSDRPDDVRIIEFFEERDLSNGRARHAFVLCLEPDLLERHRAIRADLFRFIYHPIRSCSLGQPTASRIRSAHEPSPIFSSFV